MCSTIFVAKAIRIYTCLQFASVQLHLDCDKNFRVLIVGLLVFRLQRLKSELHESKENLHSSNLRVDSSGLFI